MQAIAVGLVVLIIIIRHVPVRSEVLIEGIFDRKRHDRDTSQDVSFVAYYFENDCKSCYEKGGNPSPLFDQCHTAIHQISINISSFKPRSGDSVKIIGWKTLSGRVAMYKFVRTNFAEEFGAKQIQQEEDAWDMYQEAYDRREALKLGVTIEEYRIIEKEKSIANAVRILKLSREDVVANKYYELPGIVLYAERDARKRSQESGQIVTREEILEEDKRRIDETVKRIRHTDRCGASAEYTVRHQYDLEYAETGTLVDEDALSHIKHCSLCSRDFDDARQRFLECPKTPKCLTDEELREIRKTGMLAGDKEYPECCYRCHILFVRHQDKHFSDPSGLECLTLDDMHEIHTTGRIPEYRRLHVSVCKRCKRASEKHREKWLDEVAPLPEFPHPRMRNLKNRLRTASKI